MNINSELHTLADFNKVNKNTFKSELLPFYFFIKDYKERAHFYYERPLISPCNNEVTIWDCHTDKPRDMIMMASNNYLSLLTHPKVVTAGLNAAKKYGFGSGGVPLLSGTYELHKKLEKKLAELKGCEDAVLLASGYAANIGCISALMREKDVIIIDRLAHASLIDGSVFSKSNIKVFKHNSVAHLETILNKCKDSYDLKLIVLDGVYSMDGDIAPLVEIKKLAEKYSAMVMIDEAHATGVIGATGKGTLQHFNLEGKVDIVAGTLSKALGGVGGFIASSKEIVNYIRFYARSNMFSTSLPPSNVAAILSAIEILETEECHNQLLKSNFQYMNSKLRGMGFDIGQTESAIIPVIIGDELKLRKIVGELHRANIYANPIPFPAVSKKKCRIRLSIMASHTRENLDKTLDVLKTAAKKHQLILNNQE